MPRFHGESITRGMPRTWATEPQRRLLRALGYPEWSDRRLTRSMASAMIDEAAADLLQQLELAWWWDDFPPRWR